MILDSSTDNSNNTLQWSSQTSDTCSYIRAMMLKSTRARNYIPLMGEDDHVAYQYRKISWCEKLEQLCAYFQVAQHEVFFWSMQYFDSFLADHVCNLTPRETDLALLTCFFIATKISERVYDPTDNEILTMETLCDMYGFHMPTMVRMERRILDTLQWKIYPVTPCHFVDAFLKCMPSSGENGNRFLQSKLSDMSLSLCHIALSHGIVFHYSAAEIAFASTMISLDIQLARTDRMSPRVTREWLRLLRSLTGYEPRGDMCCQYRRCLDQVAPGLVEGLRATESPWRSDAPAIEYTEEELSTIHPIRKRSNQKRIHTASLSPDNVILGRPLQFSPFSSGLSSQTHRASWSFP